MKILSTLQTSALFLLVAGATLRADYAADFEGTGETKGSYASATVSLSGLDWNLTDVLIGTSASDWRNGVRSARLRGYGTSAMSMLADKAGGLGTLTFKYRRYGTAAQVDWRVDCSTNSGASWAQVGATFTAPANDTVQTFSAAVYATGGVRIRIRRATETGTSDRQLNIDDIVLTDHTAGANGLSIGGFTWNFDSLLPVALPTTVGIECGGISRGNNNGSSAFLTNSIPSTGYSGASGGTNGSARARGGALDTAVDGSAYLEFTLTPAPGVRAVLTDISFGARSTLTGPQAIAVYTGADGYTTPVADVLTAANNSVWALHAAESAFAFQRPTVFRVFGYNGTATTSTDNWRIDDLRVQVTTETIIPTLIRIH